MCVCVCVCVCVPGGGVKGGEVTLHSERSAIRY